MSISVVGPGQVIGERYRIVRLLGQGGMGSVYEAVQLSVERRVALKLLVDELLEQPSLVARFEREAVALARLADPHTVRLFDFGTDELRRPFIVMEFLHGSDLAEDLARNGPMRWDQALQVGRQVLGSLVEAHDAGIVHRDIKPANLFLCAGRQWPMIKVLDFGIAGGADGDRGPRKLTLTGAVLGSAAYMAPEQAQGHEAGPAADLYALGVVLFELLTGATPFDGRTFTGQLLAKVTERAPALREARPALELPVGVSVLVEELLERDATRRPPSARAVAERIAALLDGASLQPLERVVHAPALGTQPPALPRTEPMPLPRTLDDGWAPPKTANIEAAPPLAGGPRVWRALGVAALLACGGGLVWTLRSQPRAEEHSLALLPVPTSEGLAPSDTPPPGPSSSATTREPSPDTAITPSVREPSAPPEAGRQEHAATEQASPRAARELAADPPSATAPTATAPTTRQPSLSQPGALPPLAVEAPAAASGAGTAPTVARGYATVAAARAAEKDGDITPVQRNAIIARLRERRLVERARAAREYREGRIDRIELEARQRAIEQEIEGTAP